MSAYNIDIQKPLTIGFSSTILLENIPVTIYLRFVLYWVFEYIAFESYAVTSRNLDHFIMTELLINDNSTLLNTKEDP